jgi:hypothetical protein
MKIYRLYQADTSDGIQSAKHFECASDEEAKLLARELAPSSSVDLWAGPRYLGRVRPSAQELTARS